MPMTSCSGLGQFVFYALFTISFVRVVSANIRTEHTSLDDVTLCPTANRYVDEAYRCRPDVFESRVYCEGELVKLRCPPGTQIAFRSAIFGFSTALRASSACSPTNGYSHAAAATALDRSCAARCVLPTVNHICNGKRHCPFTVNMETFSERCRQGANKFLGLTYMCVTRTVARLLDSLDANENEELIQSGCSGVDYNVGGGKTSESLVPLPVSTTVPTTTTSTTAATTTTTVPTTQISTTMPTTSSTNPATTSSTSYYFGNRRNIDRAADEQLARWISTTQFYQQRYPAVQTVLPQPNYPDIDEDSISVNYPSIDSQPPQHGGVLQGVPTKHHSPSMWIYPLADWIWTWQFANDNKEKFVLYMSLGLCVGTIAVLTAVIFYFIVHHRHRRDASSDSAANGPSRRAKPGRSNTNDLMSGLHSGTIGSSCASPSWQDAMGPGVGAGGCSGGNNPGIGSRPPTHFHESESSTGDDRTLNDPDDVEMSSFNHHVDSLPRRCSAATQQLQQLSASSASATTSAGIMMTSSTLGAASSAPKCPHHSMQQQQQQQQQQQPPPPPQQQQLQQLGAGGVGASSMMRPGSSLGGPSVTTTATINRSYNPVHAPVSSAARCLTPAPLPTTSATASPPPPAPAPICNGGTMTLGHVPNGYGVRYAGYQVGGGGAGSGMTSSSNGPGMTSVPSRGPMIGSLGRSFSTSGASGQYGMDIGAYHHQPSQHGTHYHNNHGHQFDHGIPPGHNHQDIGSRTLGPLQHYYG